MRFRKRIRAFLLNRILGRENEKGLLEDEGRSADRYLLFLHRFEQCRLDLRRRAIDLVRKNDIGVDRPFLDREAPGRLIVDLRADDVRWQQIGRKLNAAERSVDCFRQCSHGQSLRESGDSFQQHVSAGKQTYQEALDHVILTNDSSPYLLHNLLNYRGISGYSGGCVHVLLLS